MGPMLSRYFNKGSTASGLRAKAEGAGKAE
jgi:hypothetical protein